MARDMSGSDDGDVVIVGMTAEPSVESVVPGMGGRWGNEEVI